MNPGRTSRAGRRLPASEPTNSPTRWLAWSLQLAVGFLAGCGVGFEAARLLLLANLYDILLAAMGGGLICGAFTSFYGNRAWMAPSIFLAPESSPPREARACSVVVGGIGGAVVLLTLIHHLIAVARRNPDSSFTGLYALPLLSAAVPGSLLVHALRNGKGFWWFGIIEREETPLIFWGYVVLNGAVVLGLLSMMA